MARVIIHAGLHKTGTSSIQYVLGKNRGRLHRQGVRFFSGRHIVDNHVELEMFALRPGRPTPFSLHAPRLGIAIDDAYRDATAAAVKKFLSISDVLLFSCEGVSLLYFPDEIARLRSLFDGHDAEIILYLRNRSDYLRSYRNTIGKRTATESDAPGAFNNFRPDSWLLDYKGRIDRFKQHFDVRAFKYENAMQASGSIVPSFLRAINVRLHPSLWKDVWRNRSQDWTTPPR